MRIAAYYSHLNGWEFLKVHKPQLWDEITDITTQVDAEKCRTKISREQRTARKVFFSPKALNQEFKQRLNEKSWYENRVSYWVTSDA